MFCPLHCIENIHTVAVWSVSVINYVLPSGSQAPHSLRIGVITVTTATCIDAKKTIQKHFVKQFLNMHDRSCQRWWKISHLLIPDATLQLLQVDCYNKQLHKLPQQPNKKFVSAVTIKGDWRVLLLCCAGSNNTKGTNSCCRLTAHIQGLCITTLVYLI